MKLLVMTLSSFIPLSGTTAILCVIFKHTHPLTPIQKHGLFFRCVVSLPCNTTGEAITLYMLMFILFVQGAKRSRF